MEVSIIFNKRIQIYDFFYSHSIHTQANIFLMLFNYKDFYQPTIGVRDIVINRVESFKNLAHPAPTPTSVSNLISSICVYFNGG